jgi:hypothetical protein
MNILPVRTNPHTSGVNQTDSSPLACAAPELLGLNRGSLTFVGEVEFPLPPQADSTAPRHSTVAVATTRTRWKRLVDTDRSVAAGSFEYRVRPSSPELQEAARIG